MPAPDSVLPRRTILGLAAAGGLGCLLPRTAGAAQIALASPVSADKPTMTVAGPGDSDAAHWARLLQVPLGAGLLSPEGVQLRFVGGLDGVTGVNQFDARAMPDGKDAVLFPGTVLLADLAGDSRVEFNMTHFVPLLAGVTQGVAMLRGSLWAQRTAPVRLACQLGLDAAAAALLAFDLLGVPAVPVDVGADEAAAAAAGAVDAVFACGCDTSLHLQTLAQAGFAPAFSAGAPPLGMQAVAPDVLALLPAAQRTAPLAMAWPSLAAAGTTSMVLAVPRLAPDSAIERWRIACMDSVTNANIGAELAPRRMRLVCGPDAAGVLAALNLPADARGALQRWLQMRLNWRPS
jgi:hypothetical protein